MIRNGGGSIVNTASVQALATTGRIAPYAAAKGGILAMTRDMARDLGQYNIRVNTICPGCIQTPMLDRSFTSNEDRDAYMERAGGLPAPGGGWDCRRTSPTWPSFWPPLSPHTSRGPPSTWTAE